MSRTLQQLQTMVRRRLGWPSTDSTVSDAELRDMLQESQREFHDFLIATYGDEYKVATQTLATSAGTNAYAPAFASRIHRVAVRFSGISYPFRRMQVADGVFDTANKTWAAGVDFRYRYVRVNDTVQLLYVSPTPDAAYVMRVVYTTSPGTFSLSTVVNSVGYDEALVLDVAIKLRNMEEVDASDLVQKLERLKLQIQNDAVPLDAGQPTVINDARTTYGGRDPWP